MIVIVAIFTKIIHFKRLCISPTYVHVITSHLFVLFTNASKQILPEYINLALYFIVHQRAAHLVLRLGHHRAVPAALRARPHRPARRAAAAATMTAPDQKRSKCILMSPLI